RNGSRKWPGQPLALRSVPPRSRWPPKVVSSFIHPHAPEARFAKHSGLRATTLAASPLWRLRFFKKQIWLRIGGSAGRLNSESGGRLPVHEMRVAVEYVRAQGNQIGHPRGYSTVVDQAIVSEMVRNQDEESEQ